MKITIAQLNPTIGDIQGNLQKLESAWKQAVKDSADLLVMTELYVTGYPPRDLLQRKGFIQRCRKAVERIAKISEKYPETGIIVGVPTAYDANTGTGIRNSAILIHDGRVVFTQHKSLLPTYDVFDEARYFNPAHDVDIVRFKNETIGISICEDAWNDREFQEGRLYNFDPIRALAEKGATLFINISASPFHLGKESIRFQLVSRHASRHGIPFIFVNQVGANDELIFDGWSIFVDRKGNAVEILPSFEEAVRTIDTGSAGVSDTVGYREGIENVHDALVLGISDYMRKCGFKSAVVGLSGGIDSAVTVALAVRAVGGENVMGVTMPSPYSADESAELSKKIAGNLGIEFKEIAIDDIYKTYRESLEPSLGFGDSVDVTLENIQARIRGNILMAISNKFGHLVLSTGNKSEMAVGYCTLYGDMSGGLAVLVDIPKTMVYELAEFINRDGEVIPRGIIDRPPSAELRPDQLDQDTLPPYPVLDEILRLYIDEGKPIEEIIGEGFDEKIVNWVAKAVNRNEYKRRQAAPGLKVTSKAFGMGRRMPIAAKYDL